jgi:hypothetical protein
MDVMDGWIDGWMVALCPTTQQKKVRFVILMAVIIKIAEFWDVWSRCL